MKATMLTAAVAAIALATWALAPLNAVPELKEITSELAATPEKHEPQMPALDVSVFVARLWNSPPSSPPQQESAVAVKPKPLNLQLVGIIEESDGTRRAAVYDVDNDRMLILSGGDSVQEHTVKSVTERAIELTNGRSTQRLVLLQERS